MVIDLGGMKPVLYLTLTFGHPHVSWPKLGMESLYLLVDRGDNKGFMPLAITTNTKGR